jgi:riboflavin kinase/FMN adenylyltransferase
MNIGVRPTVSSSGIISLEAHLLGYSGDLYGALLRFTLHRFLREEEQFPTLDALKTQLEKDKKTVELYC